MLHQDHTSINVRRNLRSGGQDGEELKVASVAMSKIVVEAVQGKVGMITTI